MMAEENRNSASEAIAKSANAANSVRGAIKTGKAIAGIAKGAAAGGPYGAVAGALCSNRHTVVKVILAAAFVMLLPVLFLLMLPSILFGNLSDTPEVPVLNNDAAIMQNMKEAELAVWVILQQSHDQVVEKIHKEIDSLGENERGIVTDAFTDGIPFDSALILSQYCASKEKYEEINVADLTNRVSREKANLFSYTKSSSTSTDEATQKTITTWHYTVTYAGDDYFAANIFRLSDEKRSLANNYAQNLMLHLYGSSYQRIGGREIGHEVRQYDPVMIQYAEQHGISGFIDVIRAIMQAESGGRGLDVMQSSECPRNTRYSNGPNSIQDPEYSIDVGIQYFADCLAAAGCKSPSESGKLSLALQGYNYGSGYIGWALDKYGGYSQANAIEFSNKKKAELGWTNYGNPRYVSDVLSYYIYPAYGGSDGWGSPFVGKNWRVAVTSEFGTRVDPLTGKAGDFHDGIDIGYPIGTPINAVKGGIVTSVTYSNTGYGYHLIIDHGNGETTLYGHCSKILVKKGQEVSKGEAIALVGKTGRSTGPHLHLTVEIDGTPKNPRNYIN